MTEEQAADVKVNKMFFPKYEGKKRKMFVEFSTIEDKTKLTSRTNYLQEDEEHPENTPELCNYIPKEVHEQFKYIDNQAFKIREKSRDEGRPLNTNLRFGIGCFELRVRLARGHPDAPDTPQPWKFVTPEVFDNLPNIQLGSKQRPVQHKPPGRTHTPQPAPSVPAPQHTPYMDQDDYDDQENDDDHEDLEDDIVDGRLNTTEEPTEEVIELDEAAMASILGPTPKKFTKHISSKHIQSQLESISNEEDISEDHQEARNIDQ